MIKIIDKTVQLDYPLGHHLHCMIAQIPNHLRKSGHGYVLTDPEEKWRQVQSILELVAAGEGNLKKLHFLMFPETAIPLARFDEMLTIIDRDFRNNTTVMFGVEHVPLQRYREILNRFREDNEEAIQLVDRDIDSGDVLNMPVNWCCIVIKEATGTCRVFLEAKSHPFHGEEFLDKDHDLYRGRHFYLFHATPSCFNFMAIICLDYLYRDLYASNIKQIIDRANQLYFTTRQGLDTLFVIQCNPKPEHSSYRDVTSGFYGEYLEDSPGVRETVTIFGNASDETVIEGSGGSGLHGHSYIIINRHHKLGRVQQREFSTDDFDGAPLCRLLFGPETRLYYFNLPLNHELDPRSSRVALKVHSVLAWGDTGWAKVMDT